MIDVHAHLPIALERDAGPALEWDLPTRLRAMDQLGIDYQILSIPHLPGTGSPDPVAEARRGNEQLGAIVASAPDRLGAFATAPAVTAEAMADEFHYACTQLGLHGLGLTSNVDGHYLGSSLFAATLDWAADTEMPVFLHPALNAASAPLLDGRPAFLIEYPFDTARSLSDALLTGTITSRPRLRLIAAHCGGALPSLAWRLQHLACIGTQQPDAGPDRQQIAEGLSQLYWDTALSGDLSVLTPIASLISDGHVLYGSDYGAATIGIVQQNRQAPLLPAGTPSGSEDALRAAATALFPHTAHL